jgi:ParB-like chromosome segregation protein Spo0J
MQVSMEPIGSILPYEKNPRKNATAIVKLAAILREVGFRQPIVVDADRVIIAGHTRLEAAKRLGMKEVPVHVATDMSPEQVKAWRIADNRVGQEAEWDTVLLKLEIGELVDMDFDTDFLGFDEDELTTLMDGEAFTIEPDEPKEAESDRGIRYSILFDSSEQRSAWFQFMNYIQGVFPHKDTLGQRLRAFIEENNYMARDEG